MLSMVDSARIKVLILQFTDGSISKEAYAELISYFNLSESEGDNENIYAAMDEVWKSTFADETYTTEEADKFYRKLVCSTEFKNYAPKHVFKVWPRYVAVAAALLIILNVGLYFYKAAILAPASVRFAKQDIGAGSNRAILTLANGKKIELAASGIYTVKDATDGKEELNNEDDMVVNTIATPRGGQYQINLSDGSSVWLNASTSLTFPVKFNKKARKVSLIGEAYFEIAKVYSSRSSLGSNRLLRGSKRSVLQAGANRQDRDNRRIPFFVDTKDQDVEVLGTHFNIKGYPDESVVKTTLLEGSVRISLSAVKHRSAHKYTSSAILNPGQQSISTSNVINVSTANAEEALAWKNGLFMFDGQDLENIMKQVARWYDVDVAFGSNDLKRQVFKGTISRFKRISQLLEVLESTGSVHFKMDGRRITAMK